MGAAAQQLRDALDVQRLPETAGYDDAVPALAAVPDMTMGEVTAAVILAALVRHNGNRSHAAREVGVVARTVRNHIQRLGVAAPPPGWCPCGLTRRGRRPALTGPSS